ncbi:ABC transporter substrate-binding protein [Leptospira sp. 2 VSF19]|uniref:ABC transporter substrate-binding protein n=1 Tax=Leptospira soteropolitanensis TaxID=2950025 RepID=A0AAW5VH15_9LEPT|nr:ABC transporter substrate-binding protein [Leptospira soteropolitanensis]MCW7494180.1 ABC transporter substrate-binding protein [Leptospira soteropolitanensis]MCW7501845.1 ABC transporter substrate-binding protein [Leptospira soteropolitanensis]MCW7524026.1 ABC transporter substrate-binding protein [Leptospira soteropolitanensis]MCW7527891.1 ABC transporter substrate-binding protein [Leptospira soteropolitanensis]MCW7531815.1 ABC transporter substrate-binding protein [Leptospira soteropolit
MRTLSLVFFLLSLTFCQKETPHFDLKIGLPSDPAHLDPLFLTDLSGQKLAKFLHQGLFAREKNGFNAPWILSYKKLPHPQNEVWRFQLNPSAPSLKDIEYSLSRLILETFPRKGDYQFLISIRVSSENQIDLTFKKGTKETEWKEKLSLPFASIIGKKEWEQGILKSYGKYKLITWKKNEFLDLTLQNEKESKFPKKIRFLILPQSSTSLFLYKKHQLDAFKLTDFLLSLPEANSEFTLTKKGRSVQYVAINQNNPCFDIHFRRAVNLAIPRELIIQKLLENHADFTYGPVPVTYMEKISKLPMIPKEIYDPKFAIEELKRSTCFSKLKTTKLEFRMRGDDENQAKGRAIKQALEEIGLKIQLKPMEKAPLYKENGEGKGDLTLLTWYSDFDSVWNFLDPLFHPNKGGNGGNRSFYKNAEVGAILNQPSKNDKDALQVIERIREDKPWIFLWSIQENYLVSRDFLRYNALVDFL